MLQFCFLSKKKEKKERGGCNNIAWHCHDLVVRWPHRFSFIKYISCWSDILVLCSLLHCPFWLVTVQIPWKKIYSFASLSLQIYFYTPNCSNVVIANGKKGQTESRIRIHWHKHPTLSYTFPFFNFWNRLKFFNNIWYSEEVWNNFSMEILW